MTVLVTKPAVNIREELASLNEPQAISDVFGLQTALDAKQPLLAEGAFVDGDKTKLDGIEATADVTDATNVEAAGAVMDSDFTSNGFMKRTGAGTYTIDASTYLTEGSALNDISDVTITGTPADNELLAYDTTTGAFINQTASEAGVQPYNSALDTYVTYALSAFELAQLGNIDSYSITGTHWSIVSGLNQNLSTTDSPVFNTATLGANSTVGAIKIGYRNIPIVAATTVGTAHVGKCLTASTTVTVPNSTMAAGDVVSIFNNSASGITLTLNPTLAYVNGADAASATLSAYGVATVLFIDSTTCVVTGNVS